MRVSAIVPAYNEASRIARVLEVLTSYSGFTEIIVVDDGSSDGTEEIARSFTIRLVRNERNRGKGAAMERGIRISCGEVLFFCDADLTGLTHRFIDTALQPVVRGEKDMFVGARASKVRHLGFGLTWTPLLDGQRAVTRELWERVPARFKSGFCIESALNHTARHSGKGLGYALFDEISHARKEEKMGYLRGTCARFAMYADVAYTTAALNISPSRLAAPQRAYA